MTAMDTVPENFVCPHCRKEIEAAEIVAAAASLMGRMGGKKGGKSEKKAVSSRENGKKGGSATSDKKAKSSAENGKKGGRPRKAATSTDKTQESTL